MNTRFMTAAAALILVALGGARAQSPAASATPVTVDSFVRAESDTYIAGLAKEGGGLAKLYHHREPASIDQQTVIRLNRDTLYSSAIFDLDAGDVTITMPDEGTRFMSLMFVSQDHYTMTEYGKGAHVLTRDKVGTRYVLAGVRTFVDPNDPEDVKKVHALQDAIQASQRDSGKLELPDWDPPSQKKVRDALLVLGSTMPDFKKAFGSKAEVDPIRHLIGTAMGWGGNPDKDAIYLNLTPPKNDGSTVYRLNIKDVPVDAFWSVSVYNAAGYFEKNPLNAYSLNSITGKRGGDGSIAIQFGGCDGRLPNCVPIVKGWNYTVRLYRPRAEILNGTWTLPNAQEVN